MKVIAKLFALSCFALFCAPLLHSQVTTLTCQTSGGPTLTIPAYAFTFNANSSATRYITVYTDLSSLNSLLVDLYFVTTYDSCTFSGNSGLFLTQITMVDVDSAGAQGGIMSPTGPQAYASVTLTAQFLSINNSAVTSGMTKPQTAAEQAKALADFKARGLALPK